MLAVDRQAVSGLHAQRSQLLADIADGLGVVLEASRSGIELERQLRAALAHAEEIAVSRRRTVAEMDGERRRIERDLHDGAQHHLVSLRLTLGLVEHQVATGDLDQAREWLEKLAGQLADAEAVLAATADGVSSLVLAEQGLVAALRTELGAAHPPVGLRRRRGRRRRLSGGGRGGRVVLLRRGGRATRASTLRALRSAVRLAERRGVLTFTVRDEGPGFAVGRRRARRRAWPAEHDDAALGGGRARGGPVGAGGGDDGGGRRPAAGGRVRGGAGRAGAADAGLGRAGAAWAGRGAELEPADDVPVAEPEPVPEPPVIEPAP